MLLVFKASSMKSACFWRFSRTFVFIFKPTNKNFAFIELTSFLSFDSEVPSFYFESMPPFAHKPVLHSQKDESRALSADSYKAYRKRRAFYWNLSCIRASKPLNGQYCTWARSHRDRHYDCACYTVFTRFWCTPTQNVQPKPSSSFALRHWLPK